MFFQELVESVYFKCVLSHLVDCKQLYCLSGKLSIAMYCI